MNLSIHEREHLAFLLDGEIATRSQVVDYETGEAVEEILSACLLYEKFTGERHAWLASEITTAKFGAFAAEHRQSPFLAAYNSFSA